MTEATQIRADFTGAIRKTAALLKLAKAHKFVATEWAVDTVRILKMKARAMQKSGKGKKTSQMFRNIGFLVGAGDDRWTIAIGTGIGGTQSVPYAKIQDEGGTTHPKVTKRMRRWIAPTEAIAFPVYGVHASDGQAPEEDAGEYREEFAVVVEGVVKSAIDTVTEMEHALADVRRAVDADSRSGNPGTLGALTVFVRVGRSWTDEGENVASGLGYFWQEFLVQIAGDPFGA